MQPVSYTRHHPTLARFILLFAFLYAAFGVSSPSPILPERPRAEPGRRVGLRPAPRSDW